MKKPSEYVRIPRSQAEAMLKKVREIATRDKSVGHGDGYAHALGACNGDAKVIAADMEAYLNA